MGAEIVDDTTWSMRQYFVALTLASVIVAALVAVMVRVVRRLERERVETQSGVTRPAG